MAALAATVISAVFALTLGRQYRTRRRPYLLAWCVALSVYAASALTEVVGAVNGWDPLLFRAYYFLGGIVLVGVLALGTLFLLAPRAAPFAADVLTALALLGLVAVAGAQIHGEFLQTRQVPPLKAIPWETPFNVVAIVLAIGINSTGTVILVVGALWSAYSLWRHGAPRERLVANVLIAVGALIPALASSLTRVVNYYDLFYFGQAAGVLLMFLGFLAAQQVRVAVQLPRASS